MLSGAAGAASTTLGIATAATNHNTRHPLVTATFATTMHRMTGGRFALGLGRGFDALFDVIGPRITMAQLEDFAGIMRRLWHGEMILGHDGPAGRYTYLNQDPSFDEDIPIMLVALGPDARVRGRVADGVVLHTFFTDETLAAIGRGGPPRRRAGRSRPGERAGVVGARDRRRPHRRGVAAAQARRPVRDLPPGLRRPARLGERVGPGRARALPPGRDGRVVPGRVRREREPRSSSTCRRSSRPSGWRRRRRVPRSSARRG